MKQILLGMFAMTGLILAGSETEFFINQVILSTAGVCIFAVSMFGIIETFRG